MTLKDAAHLAIETLGDDAYGVPIRRETGRIFGREVSYGALYVALEALEDEGLVKSTWGEATAERGWRRKKYYCCLVAPRPLVVGRAE